MQRMYVWPSLLYFPFSFAVLPMDTPSPDPTTNYITPSPTANECQLPKAPKARKVSRQMIYHHIMWSIKWKVYHKWGKFEILWFFSFPNMYDSLHKWVIKYNGASVAQSSEQAPFTSEVVGLILDMWKKVGPHSTESCGVFPEHSSFLP